MTTELPELNVCIVCLSAKADSLEHVIPESIGGKLVAPILCKKCNHNLGSKLAGDLKEVQFIRDALRILKPRIAASLQKGQEAQPLIGRSEDGSIIKALYTEGKGIYVRQGPGANGSRILDTKDALKEIRNRLAKDDQNLNIDILADLLEAYAQADSGKELLLPDGSVFLNKEGPKLQPDISATLVNPYLAVLIAYEYLALLIGRKIYEDRFQFIRTAITSQQPSDRIVVTPMRSGDKPEPVHAIKPEKTATGIKITIFLFRYLVFEVELLGLDDSVPGFVYVQDLESKEKGVVVYQDGEPVGYLPYQAPELGESTY